MSSKILLKSLIVNLFLTIVKFIGSVLGNSKTLISDAVHSFSDMSTDNFLVRNQIKNILMDMVE